MPLRPLGNVVQSSSQIMVVTLEISVARKQFNSFDSQLEDTPVIHNTRHSKPVFAIVSLAHFSSLMDTLEILCDPDALKMLQQSTDDIIAGRLHDHDDVMRELG